ncbi:MAG: hypothetical protein P8Y80_00960, partial [Acidobacteriota bacterium]
LKIADCETDTSVCITGKSRKALAKGWGEEKPSWFFPKEEAPTDGWNSLLSNSGTRSPLRVQLPGYGFRGFSALTGFALTPNTPIKFSYFH